MASSPIRQWFRSSPLGSGSFGTVSLAVNLDDGGLFAVKSTPCSSPSPSTELRAIENELDILLSLDSPRILRCFGGDYSTENGVSARNLFLEYMAGGSIADLMKKSGGKLDESRVRLYAREILEGLHYLHERRIAHCDIKGQNVLVGASGAKIADFGSAKRLRSFKDEEVSVSTEAGSFKGTPLWMAPEVVQGVEQGLPSDIWSFGCTIVEMLQGRPPWDNTTSLAALLFQIGCSQENPPLPESVSAEAKDFLQKCLQRNPRARWTTAQLLEHPFVKIQSKSDRHSPRSGDQSSPKSILELLCDSDYEDESINSVPILSLPTRIAKSSSLRSTIAQEADSIFRRARDIPMVLESVESLVPSIKEINLPKSDEWITVRRTNGWSQDRQKPFMESLQAGDQNLVQLKNGREVNLESLAFLRKRRYAE